MRAIAILFASALLFAACAVEDAPVEQSKSAALEQGQTGDPNTDLSANFDANFDAEKERAIKEGPASRELVTRVSPVDWEEANDFVRLEAEVAGEKAAANLSQAEIPALVPARAELLQEATVTGGETWYAVSMQGEGVTVYVSGNNKEVVVPGLEIAEKYPGIQDDFRVSRAEGIASLTFNAFGVAYLVEVECAEPASDARCTGDDYVISLANDLAIANPGGK